MNDQPGAGRSSCITHHESCLPALLCSFIAFVLSFWGLFEWDVPLTRFIRTLYHPIGYLPNPWLAQLSNSGDHLGKGESLLILSLALLAGGFALKQVVLKTAGWQTFLAHGVAALISNVLKHLVGRPRPKFMHAGHASFTPAGGSGWDSFPSGHTTASFAVAAVLAVRFPKFRWIVLGLSVMIAASRILRGSHFLTDAAGGAALGYMIGTVAAYPWRDWRSSLASALLAVTPFLAGLLALVWTIGHHPTDLWPTPQLIAAGMLITIAGLIMHALRVLEAVNLPFWISKRLTQAAIGIGLGMTTGSLWVTAAVSFVCLAHWLGKRSEVSHLAGESTDERYTLTREAVFSLLVLLGLLVTIEFRGALPMV